MRSLVHSNPLDLGIKMCNIETILIVETMLGAYIVIFLGIP